MSASKERQTCVRERVGSPAPTPPAKQTRHSQNRRTGRQACLALRQLVQTGEGTALPPQNFVLRMLWADSPSSSDAMAVWDQRSDSYPSGSQAPLQSPCFCHTECGSSASHSSSCDRCTWCSSPAGHHELAQQVRQGDGGADRDSAL